MGIILTEPAEIKAFETTDESDIDVTATELLELREFVVESYDIDEAKQETIFYCRIRLDYGICPRCRSVSGDIHQYKRRRVRDMMCFGRTIYLIFDIRRFRCPNCHKVFTESLDSIALNQRYTMRFEMRSRDCSLFMCFLHCSGRYIDSKNAFAASLSILQIGSKLNGFLTHGSVK